MINAGIEPFRESGVCLEEERLHEMQEMEMQDRAGKEEKRRRGEAPVS